MLIDITQKLANFNSSDMQKSTCEQIKHESRKRGMKIRNNVEQGTRKTNTCPSDI